MLKLRSPRLHSSYYSVNSSLRLHPNPISPSKCAGMWAIYPCTHPMVRIRSTRPSACQLKYAEGNSLEMGGPGRPGSGLGHAVATLPASCLLLPPQDLSLCSAGSSDVWLLPLLPSHPSLAGCSLLLTQPGSKGRSIRCFPVAEHHPGGCWHTLDTWQLGHQEGAEALCLCYSRSRPLEDTQRLPRKEGSRIPTKKSEKAVRCQRDSG